MAGAPPLPRALKHVLGKRRAPRIPMNADGPVAVVGASLVNVSPFGMLIHAPLPMSAEQIHRFRLRIRQEVRDVEARVAMCVSGGKHRYDIGLEFVGPVDDLRAHLTEVLAPLAPHA